MDAATTAAPAEAWWRQLLAGLPRGSSLRDDVWARRHRLVVWLLALHVPALAFVALRLGHSAPTALAAAAVVAAFAGVAAVPAGHRTVRSLVGSTGLVTCSTLVAWLSAGLVEFHLHFFVVLTIVALYQEWVPFAGAVLYLLVHHGIVGAVDPSSIYHHPYAAENPWRWAVVHAVLVAAACAAYVAQWRLTEDLRDDTDLLMESTGEGVLGIDLRGRVTFANPAAAGLLGQPRERLVGMHTRRLFEGLAVAPPTLAPASLPSRRPQEAMALASGGRSVPVEVIVTPSVRRGIVHGQVLAFRDVTDRKAAEEAQRHAQEQELRRLKELDDMKTLFLSNAAHELRTPLTPLALQIELMRLRIESGEATADELRSVDVLQRNFTRLQALIEDILNVARLDAGGVTLRTEPVDLARAVQDVQETFVPMAGKAAIRIESDVPHGLWVRADPLRLHQVLVNLVGNALRYTDGPGVVRIEGEAAEGEATLRVADTGRGLAKEQIARLFQPFGQVHDGSGAERTGTGLGLYVTKGLVELHGGRIWVESAGPGHGSTFSFTLPRCAAPVADLVAKPAQSPDGLLPARLGTP